MNSFFQKLFEKPIFVLLAANIIVGLFIFRDYGFSWDEPLFYDYGNAVGYAYSPAEWFSGNFDVSNSYGSSGDDHKTRGPAYLLLSREPVYLLEAFGLDQASAWHLVNFLFFQVGVYFLYRLSRRWVQPMAALATSALFAWQPMLWGHAFINPKDPPFLTFFLASVCLGFEMVDRLDQDGKPKWSTVVIPAIILGITTSIRILGPLAGALVFIYFLFTSFSKKHPRDGSTWFAFVLYGLIAVVTMFLTWPYLWEQPIAR
ncbi:MAG: glycosyltransferase family 39 protein, partial [Byssovorax cruenta]